MIPAASGPGPRPADLARWMNEDALRALEALLGRTLAQLELYELRKDECLSIAGAFGLPFAVQLAAGKRLQQLDTRIGIARETIGELRIRVDTFRRQLGMYRPPPRVEPPTSPAMQRATRAVQRDLLQTVDRELAKRRATGSPDEPKLQNEARPGDVDDYEDDLDWTR